jgi:hypothetical protein
MHVEQLIGNVAQILLYIGGPVIPLLLLAIQIGRWHDANRNGEW